jgi:hypothetical protein
VQFTTRQLEDIVSRAIVYAFTASQAKPVYELALEFLAKEPK